MTYKQAWSPLYEILINIISQFVYLIKQLWLINLI